MREDLWKKLLNTEKASMDRYEEAMEKWDNISMPLGALGVLQEDVARIARIKDNININLQKRSLIVVCADNGVVAKGVSQCGPEVTEAVAKALGAGESTASYMANACRCSVIPVDCGMLCDTPPGVLDRKVRNGTADISAEPAMSPDECLQAIRLGEELVRDRQEAGDDIILLGEMGIGNTTTSAAVSCVLLGKEPDELTGRGAGLSDEALKRKREVISRAISVNRPDKGDIYDVICKVGGLDIAMLCGICLGAAKYRVPVILDGLITNVAALCAARLDESVKEVLLASHTSKEPAARSILCELGLEAAIDAGLRLGEGTGALLFLSMLDQVLAVYESGHTFDALGIDAYVPQ